RYRSLSRASGPRRHRRAARRASLVRGTGARVQRGVAGLRPVRSRGAVRIDWLGAIPPQRWDAVAKRPAPPAPRRGALDSVREGRPGGKGFREAALQVVARARAPRSPRSGRVGPSSQLEDFAPAHPEVHDLLRPTPERVLPFHGDTWVSPWNGRTRSGVGRSRSWTSGCAGAKSSS